MKTLIILSLLIWNTLSLFSQNADKEYFYVGTFTNKGSKGIYLCEFSNINGDIELKQTFAAVDNPSFLKISSDKKYLYAVCRAPGAVETSGGYVQAYRIDKNRNLLFLNKQKSHGGDPCHVDVSGNGKYVAIANYGGGSIALYPVSENGSLKRASSVIQNEGSGVNPDRQTKPHAHSIKFSPTSNLVFSADLGTDQLDMFTIENNMLIKSAQEYVKLAPGAGPRHFDFSNDGESVFVINELNSTISTVQKLNNQWEIVQTISTLPEGFEGSSYCADIHVSRDGRFLYGSNRGHNTIAVFEIEEKTKKLTGKGYVSVEGDWPRNFALSPDGKHMLVANQKSGNITVFKIDKETGIPEFTGNEIKLPEPVCIEFL